MTPLRNKSRSKLTTLGVMPIEITLIKPFINYNEVA